MIGGGHANETDYIISEFQEFNLTIQKVLDYAKADGNTLVIVTADHETGGFAITGGDLKRSSSKRKFQYRKVIQPQWYPYLATAPTLSYLQGFMKIRQSSTKC